MNQFEPAPVPLPNFVRQAEAKVDPLGWVPATTNVLKRSLRHPDALALALGRFASRSALLPARSLVRALNVSGGDAEASKSSSDKRFADPAWEENPYFFSLRQYYDLWCQFIDEVLAAGQGDRIEDLKASMAVHLVLDALAPVNFLVTNPTALSRAFQTGGKSLVRATGLAISDIVTNGGMPEKVDRSAFVVGKDLAATPGSVVFRNDLIELIQYAPQTDQVRSVPLLCSPPWINKYYVMDLAPRRSLIEWAVQHGRNCFAISYRNPDESMGDLTMDDYIENGLLTAIDVVADITGSNKVDIAALCLGGAVTAMTAALLAMRGDDRIGTLTLLNTMLDYSDPGDLSAFVDQESLRRLEGRMSESGYLHSSDMALAFDLLRPRDLIFRYIPDRWLMGETSAPFDILAWNGDATRMPAAMHNGYLRDLYHQNQLARGVLEIHGTRLDPKAITSDTYIVGAINDHIVPWQASYSSAGLLGGDVRYVLSSGGHIAGVVNPPSPKAWFETSEYVPGDPQGWRSSATRTPASWWEDWTSWADARAGEFVAPPEKLGNDRYAPMDAAPGKYVHG
ncbi:alpha/beta fold hydrolase [Gordonia sp. TBRC 11910]|uniref:Alpha/beta fold hydrolase n=1 Tax=Gordonia asplenii TaxID=2725283 RepID=A0A848L868_9ACTN|nr:alpha/beta fold hydrolase [Gordonia asplenii]NMO04671.1 alpha/beta fold hydrolase [Gordonia asplenii]